jgi:hypothetical protein
MHVMCGVYSVKTFTTGATKTIKSNKALLAKFLKYEVDQVTLTRLRHLPPPPPTHTHTHTLAHWRQS